jgi:hypothetical protein
MDEFAPPVTKTQEQAIVEALWAAVQPSTVPDRDFLEMCRLRDVYLRLEQRNALAGWWNWHSLVHGLADICERLGAAPSASNWRTDKATPFVTLVQAVLETLPRELRIHGAHRLAMELGEADWGALSKAVQRKLSGRPPRGQSGARVA